MFSKDGGRKVLAVDDISFEINRGECLGLVGESGCGKTTTSKMIMRALSPDAGEVIFNQGDPAVGMYIIIEGEVEVTYEPSGRVLTTLASGEFFGELALFDQSSRSAKATASKDSRIICMPAGTPSPAIALIRIRSGRHEIICRLPPRDRSIHHTTPPRASNMNTRATVVAHADPTAPSAGAPRFPKTKTQLAKTLSTLAASTTSITGRTRPIACR